jgi:CBS domain-containing protein
MTGQPEARRGPTTTEYQHDTTTSGQRQRTALPGVAGFPALQIDEDVSTMTLPGIHQVTTLKVVDVMTTPVITADLFTPYKEIARLLAEHKISGLPVLRLGWQVVGVVTEADLLAVQDQAARQVRLAGGRPGRRPRYPGLVAGELMTTPPVTIEPDATALAAVAVMTAQHVRRLPVTGDDRQLVGIVSRRDLLNVYLRPDPGIAADVRRVLEHILPADPERVTVAVRHGVVTLTGTIEPVAARHDSILAVTSLIADVAGVVDVVNRLTVVWP